MATAPLWTYNNFTNLTIEVPVGTKIYRNGKELCLPITIVEILAFFLLNFATHVATVVSTPGEATDVNVANMLLALLFPTSGLMRALNFIARRVISGKDDLDKACRAGALVIVVRNRYWRPPSGQALKVVVEREELQAAEADMELGSQSKAFEATYAMYHPCWLKENLTYWIYADTLWGRTVVDDSWSKIHGTYMLPRGYSFAVLPHDTVVVPRVMNFTQLAGVTNNVSASNNKAKVILSTIQLLYASYTLFGHRGDQFKAYGFASPYILVIPYAIMSFVNGVAHLLTPEYASLFMVYSAGMKEAMNATGKFEGVIGQVIHVDSGPDVCQGFHPSRPNGMGFGSSFDFGWSGVTESGIRNFWGHASGFYSTGLFLYQGVGAFFPWLLHRLYLHFDQRSTKTWSIVHTVLHFGEVGSALEHEEHSSTDAAITLLPQIELHTLAQEYCTATTDRTQIMQDMVRPRSWEHLVAEDLYYNSLGDESGELSSQIANPSQSSPLLVSRERMSISPSLQYSNNTGCDLTDASPLQISESPPMSTPADSDQPPVYNIVPVRTKPRHSLLKSIWTGNREEVKKWLTKSEPLTPINLLGFVIWAFNPQQLQKLWSAWVVAPSKYPEAEPAMVYVPTCTRFLRKSDPEFASYPEPLKPHIARLAAQSLRMAGVATESVHKTNTIQVLPRPEKPMTFIAIVLQFLLGIGTSAITFAVIGYFTGFSPGESSITQQAITMSWLGLGILVGVIMPFFTVTDLLVVCLLSPYYGLSATGSYIGMLPLGLFIPPIWGLLEVGLMLREHCLMLY